MAMILYIISGIVMAVGVYFTIRYRPYCTMKSPKREIAMELHRKKLTDEPMSDAEIKQHDLYQHRTKLYIIGDFILWIAIPVHIIGVLHFSQSHSLYIVSLILIGMLYLGHRYTLPYCFKSFIASLWNVKDKYVLEAIKTYFQKTQGKVLSDEDMAIYREEVYAKQYFEFYRYSVNSGVLLCLILDVWFSLNGSLIFK